MEEQFERDRKFFEQGGQHIKTEIKMLIDCLELCGEIMLSKEKVIKILKELLDD